MFVAVFWTEEEAIYRQLACCTPRHMWPLAQTETFVIETRYSTFQLNVDNNNFKDVCQISALIMEVEQMTDMLQF